MNYFNFKQILLDVALHTIAFIGLASFAVYYHVYGNGFILYEFIQILLKLSCILNRCRQYQQENSDRARITLIDSHSEPSRIIIQEILQLPHINTNVINARVKELISQFVPKLSQLLKQFLNSEIKLKNEKRKLMMKRIRRFFQEVNLRSKRLTKTF